MQVAPQTPPKFLHYGCAAFGRKVGVFPVYRENGALVHGEVVALFPSTKQAMEDTGRRNLAIAVAKAAEGRS
jgi:hypothetical protein